MFHGLLEPQWDSALAVTPRVGARRERDGHAEPVTFFGREQSLNAAERASRDDDPLRIDEWLFLQPLERIEDIPVLQFVELDPLLSVILGFMDQVHDAVAMGRWLVKAANGVKSDETVIAERFRPSVPRTHRRFASVVHYHGEVRFVRARPFRLVE